ncbi:OLC1v1006360C1 [Oldenlandia corymbosa var. corymbosa]|uniref:OLC1v1006360C1 n=1 Tax=Oldenlandia corymbosa var. corymbosa TaxID=529605 RepID=A0AAV1DHA8_OLDCO|nr:OLC1v1006360C1 [Oldenlandia corymbosa var. corymbosa]
MTRVINPFDFVHPLAIVPYEGGRDSGSLYSVDHGHLNDDPCPKEEKASATNVGLQKAADSRNKDKFAGDEVPYTRRPKGTTTLAFICKEGVMVATDHSDASKDASETFVENVIDLDSHVLVTVSGVGETRSFLKNLKDQFQAVKKGTKSVFEVSQWVAGHLSSHPDKHLSAKVLIAGWDDESQCHALYSVNSEGEVFQKRRDATGAVVLTCWVFWCISFDKKWYGSAVEHAKWMIRSTAGALEHFRSLGQVNTEYSGYVSGYYVSAARWKRSFYNLQVPPGYFYESIGWPIF